jgi:hypothetical protein
MGYPPTVPDPKTRLDDQRAQTHMEYDLVPSAQSATVEATNQLLDVPTTLDREKPVLTNHFQLAR